MIAKPVLYHAPNTRSTTIVWLDEELGRPCDIELVNTANGDNRKPPYLAVNPLGKVPALKHGDAVVTEAGAICLYLADLYSPGNLAPAATDPARGPYLRWTVFYHASFEPALIDVAMKREPGPLAMSPYGTFEATIGAIAGALAKGPFLLGEKFTAADVLWGSGLRWTMMFGIVPKRPEFTAYVERLDAREAWKRAQVRDAQFKATLGG